MGSSSTPGDRLRSGAVLERLVRGGLAYQAASVLAGLIALGTLPLYTRFLTRAELGLAETLLTLIILASILLRLGLQEALLRAWAQAPDRPALARTVTTTVLLASTAAALLVALAAGPVSEALLGERQPALLRAAALGLWAFTNLEVANALLRAEERRRTYLRASLANVLATVGLTVLLVVVLERGAVGYLLGNYVASAAVLVALWVARPGVLGAPSVPLGPLVRFGAPTVPADATVFALNVVDRAWLVRADSAAAAGVYAVAVKLATAVIVAARAFQAAWPPLAYGDADERTYARVTTYYVAVVGCVVAALALLARPLVDLLAADAFVPAHEALPWVALGWGLYGLFLVFVTIAGRARATVRTLPPAVLGLAVNVAALALLVEPLGPEGAGIALCASYVVMLVAARLLTRRLLAVPFERRRLATAVAVLTGAVVAGDAALPEGAWAARAALAAALPLALLALDVIPRQDVAVARRRLRGAS
jgi:O-antigen/teichoic acid export membrane protein